MAKQIDIACVLRSSTDPEKPSQYSYLDVLKLKTAFEKFLKIDHSFICLSDVSIPKVQTISLIGDTPGWWAKIELFRPEIFKRPVFYIDLDMVICDDITDFILKCQNEQFLMLTNHKDSINKDNKPASAIMYWNGDYSFLWNEYLKSPAAWQKEYSVHPRLGDQAFISERVDWKSLFSVEGINEEWFTWLSPKISSTTETKILIGEGKRKPSNPKYKDHPLIKKNS